ncbi:MAG: glycoside hydrolase [Thermoproteota archaeon]|nr:glycoside hydrolase [Thermoproteota archaeon]
MLEISFRNMKRKKIKGILAPTSMAVLLLLASTIVAANLSLQAVYAQGSFFKDPKNISETNVESSFEAVRGKNIATSGKYVYVTWREDVPGNPEIYFTRSTDGGKTFEKPESISGNVVMPANSQIAAYGKNVYVVFQGTSPAGDVEIFLARSTDRGEDFDRPKNISNEPGASEIPNIDVFEDNVFVVWEQEIPGAPVFTFDIFVTGSNNGGDDFDEPKPKNISNNPGESRNAQVSVSEDTAYVVWEDDQGIGGMLDIFFNRGKD